MPPVFKTLFIRASPARSKEWAGLFFRACAGDVHVARSGESGDVDVPRTRAGVARWRGVGGRGCPPYTGRSRPLAGSRGTWTSPVHGGRVGVTSRSPPQS